MAASRSALALGGDHVRGKPSELRLPVLASRFFARWPAPPLSVYFRWNVLVVLRTEQPVEVRLHPREPCIGLRLKVVKDPAERSLDVGQDLIHPRNQPVPQG